MGGWDIISLKVLLHITAYDKITIMSIQEIEQAIARLPRSEVALLSQWLEKFEAELWNEQVARDLKSNQPRPYGLCAGEFTVPQDFDAPLPEDIIASFEG